MSFFVLHDQLIKENAKRAIDRAPYGITVLIEEQKKSRMAEMKYHAIFAEVANQRTFMGKKWDAETWKRLLVDAFARVKSAEGEPIQGHGAMVPNLDHTGFVQLGVQTRRFTKKEASEFIEFLHAWMADQEVAA